MEDLLIALVVFGLSVAAHVAVCRRTESQGLLAKVFCKIALVGLVFCWVLFALKGRCGAGLKPSLWDLPLEGTATVLYILMVPAYLVVYVSTQLISPSKKIMVLLKASGPLSRQQLLKNFTDEEFIVPRLRDLTQSGCVSCREGRYRVLPAGQKIAWFLEVYQMALGRKVGG